MSVYKAVLPTFVSACICVEETSPYVIQVPVFVALLKQDHLQGGVYFCEGGYDRIAPKLFDNLNVDAFYVSHPNG
jgi:hypothetical protein